MNFLLNLTKGKKNRGVSVTELLLVIALMSIISAATIPLGINFMRKNQTKNTKDVLISYLNSARNYAMSGKHNNSWGIYITNTSITLFNGENYSTRNTELDQEFEIPGTVTLTTGEIIFSKESGNTSNTTLNITGTEGTSYTVSVDTQGNITYD